jgi:hypothetical protein
LTSSGLSRSSLDASQSAACAASASLRATERSVSSIRRSAGRRSHGIAAPREFPEWSLRASFRSVRGHRLATDSPDG